MMSYGELRLGALSQGGVRRLGPRRESDPRAIKITERTHRSHSGDLDWYRSFY
jgi:hypothetical protein